MLEEKHKQILNDEITSSIHTRETYNQENQKK